MAYTTSNAIRIALERTLSALIPTGNPMNQSRYRKVKVGIDWEKVSLSQKDRGFRVGLIQRGEPMVFGIKTEIEYTGFFIVTVGHVKDGRDKEASLARANTDLDQISANLEKKGNFPSGVNLIRLTNIDFTDEDDRSWKTDLLFRIEYALVAP